MMGSRSAAKGSLRWRAEGLGNTLVTVCWGTNLNACLRPCSCNIVAQLQHLPHSMHACVYVAVDSTHTVLTCLQFNDLCTCTEQCPHGGLRVPHAWQTFSEQTFCRECTCHTQQAQSRSAWVSGITSGRHCTEAEYQPRAHENSSQRQPGSVCAGGR